MTSGLLIREARLLAGLSQDELGARVGKDRAQIARWERGAVEPSFETLRELVERVASSSPSRSSLLSDRQGGPTKDLQ